MIYVWYLLNHMSCKVLDGSVLLIFLYGSNPEIIILLLYTFHQQVFKATYKSYPSASEERAAFQVGFGEHVGDALTHKLLDAETQENHLYICCETI